LPEACQPPVIDRQFFLRAKKITETEILNRVYNAADYEKPMSTYYNGAAAPDKFVLPAA
jgi:hypothetical protein